MPFLLKHSMPSRTASVFIDYGIHRAQSPRVNKVPHYYVFFVSNCGFLCFYFIKAPRPSADMNTHFKTHVLCLHDAFLCNYVFGVQCTWLVCVVEHSEPITWNQTTIYVFCV